MWDILNIQSFGLSLNAPSSNFIKSGYRNRKGIKDFFSSPVFCPSCINIDSILLNYLSWPFELCLQLPLRLGVVHLHIFSFCQLRLFNVRFFCLCRRGKKSTNNCGKRTRILIFFKYSCPGLTHLLVCAEN